MSAISCYRQQVPIGTNANSTFSDINHIKKFKRSSERQRILLRVDRESKIKTMIGHSLADQLFVVRTANSVLRFKIRSLHFDSQR